MSSLVMGESLGLFCAERFTYRGQTLILFLLKDPTAARYENDILPISASIAEVN